MSPIRLVAGLLVLLALGLAACDGSDDNGENDSTEGEPTVSSDGPPDVSGEATVTASGLRIIEIQAGDGETAQAGGRVTVHYTGWLTDGTKFDSSVDRGTPAEFPLDGVIQGWQEGIPGMQIGEKRRLIIPSDLGYGKAGFPPDIPPGAELIFDVELIAVE